MGHIGGEKNRGAVGAEGVHSGQAEILEFFAYKNGDQGNCNRRRRVATNAEGKQPLPTGTFHAKMECILGYC